ESSTSVRALHARIDGGADARAAGAFAVRYPIDTTKKGASPEARGWICGHPGLVNATSVSRRTALEAIAAAASSAILGRDDRLRGTAWRLHLSRPKVAQAPDDGLPLPRRGPSAPTGTRFMQLTRSLSLAERERAVLDEILAGNVPSFERKLVSLPIVHRC